MVGVGGRLRRPPPPPLGRSGEAFGPSRPPQWNCFLFESPLKRSGDREKAEKYEEYYHIPVPAGHSMRTPAKLGNPKVSLLMSAAPYSSARSFGLFTDAWSLRHIVRRGHRGLNVILGYSSFAVAAHRASTSAGRYPCIGSRLLIFIHTHRKLIAQCGVDQNGGTL